MNKQELLNYLANQQKRVKKATNLEKSLDRKKKYYQHVKGSWNFIIWGSIIIASFSVVMNYPYNTFSPVTIFLYILGGVLFFYKRSKLNKASSEVSEVESSLLKEMATAKYQEGLRDFPIKFYDYDDIYRLYQLVNENRVSTLQEAFNLLENQLNAEYQNHLAEQTLLAAQATERSARITAVSTALTAYNTSKK